MGSRSCFARLAINCFYRDLEEVKKIILETNVIAKNPCKKGIFLLQVIRGTWNDSENLTSGIEVMKFLLQNGLQVNETTYNSDGLSVTPLFLACSQGIPQYVRFLLKSGADPTYINNDGYSILAETVKIMMDKEEENQGPWEETLELILDWCLKNSKNGSSEMKYFQLCHALCLDEIENCGKFLEGYQDVDFKELKFDSPLLIAVLINDINWVQALIAKGADVNLMKNRPILHEALVSADNDVIQFLLDQPGINVVEIVENIHGCDQLDEHQMTPLMISCFLDQTEVVQRLLDLGVDVLKTDDDGFTALHLACDQENLSCIEILLKQMNPNVFTKTGLTPLHLACTGTNVEVVQKLLEHNADIKAVDKSNLSVLHHAASEADSTNILQFLLNTKHLDVNAEDKKGLTPLDEAIQYFCCNNVKVLIQFGAEMKLPDRFDQKKKYAKHLLHHAIHCKDCHIVKTFLKLKLLGVEFDTDYDRIFLINEFTEMIPKYEEELAKLKNTVINSNLKISLYDFIMMNRKKASIYSNNRVLKDLYIECGENFQEKFHSFGFLMNLKYIKGLKRFELLAESTETFNSLIGDHVVEVASEIVLSYLNTVQLEEFIKLKEELQN